MTVYVDHASNPFGRMKMSHLMADTDAELENVAYALRLNKEWRDGDHYDISEGKRLAAIHFGATPVTSRELVRLRRRKRALA